MSLKKISLIGILIFLYSGDNLLSSDLLKPELLTKSEQFIKDLYQQYPQTITFLRQFEVSSTLANKLNALFTRDIQEKFTSRWRLESSTMEYLKKKGFQFYSDSVFYHKLFPTYIFKISRFFYDAEDLKNYFVLNASRIWLAQWLRIIQSEFEIPYKQVYFMKSDFPELAIVVVAQKKDFEKTALSSSFKEKVILKKIEEITGYDDYHSSGNVRSKIIVDTEDLALFPPKQFSKFLTDPFSIYEDPLRKKEQIKSKL